MQVAIDSVEIDRLRTTGRITGECQLALPCKRVDKAGLSYVASSQERYLGQSASGELLGTTGTVDEFCFQFYYTRREGGSKRD
jgi:hypothetical protein